MRTRNFLGCAALVGAGLLAACAPENGDDLEEVEEASNSLVRGACASAPDRYKGWCKERSERQAALDAYVADHDDDAREFTAGAFATQGIPLILFRLLPEVFPEIWGPYAERMSVLGMGANPYNSRAAVPLGFAITQGSVLSTPLGDVKIAMATLACSYCHVGRVEGDDGKVMHLLGAPASQNVNLLEYHRASALSARLTAKNFRTKLLTKPIGWLFPNDVGAVPRELFERSLFLVPGVAEKMLAEYKKQMLAASGIFEATFGRYTYGVPHAPNPSLPRRGSMDSVNLGILPRMDPTALPTASDLAPAPAEVDMMATWRQADRPNSHWDGSFPDKMTRNAAAAIGTVNPADYRIENGYATTAFTEHLPAPPYPFDVDLRLAKRGKPLFQKYCSSCHAPGSSRIMSPAATGTDPNRANQLQPYGVAKLIESVRDGLCRIPATCKNPDGSDLTDDQILKPTGGYVALPLTGVWATAPYLHNGSVPTLRALMTGKRPTKFYRGNIAYDKENVGFKYDVSTTETTEYDTSLAGFSNEGHTGPEFLGDVDWRVETEKLDALLEYMKTL